MDDGRGRQDQRPSGRAVLPNLDLLASEGRRAHQRTVADVAPPLAVRPASERRLQRLHQTEEIHQVCERLAA